MLHQGNLHTLLNSYQGSLKIIKVDLHINLFLKDSRLLQPQHLGGICSGLIPYRLPYVSIQNPGSIKEKKVCPRVVQKFQLWNKRKSQTWGRNAVKKLSPCFLWTMIFLSRKWSPLKVRTQFFFKQHFPFMPGTLFFFRAERFRLL